MISLRERIREAYGVEGAFSVARQVLGYLDPQAPKDSSQSLREHLSLVDGPHLDLDLILVGVEDFGDLKRKKIDIALSGARALFAPGGIGIKHVFHGALTLAEADGYDRIDSEEESVLLRQDFSGPNKNAVDVFFVHEMNIGGGRGVARRNGSCNKSVRNKAGCVLDIRGTEGTLLAHELGHHLSLQHVGDPSNLMFESANGGEFSASQFADMKRHCSMQGTG